MKKAGIMIEEWKLGTFKKHLDEAGFAFTRHPGISQGTLLLKVPCEDDDIGRLQKMIEAAQLDCRAKRMW